ncbi:MAG: hypothetical protein II877_01905 [Synergistaceae bacterium]|nr:hypothetical protein [Synergistaceae bacterium]
MSTNTFDRPLVLVKEEDIERFWYVMEHAEPQLLYYSRKFFEEMDECAELFL